MALNSGDDQRTYPPEPENKTAYTEKYDRFYTRTAQIYNLFVNTLPIWKRWLKHALPYLQGPRLLEISFGTGYLMTQFADRYTTFGLEYNAAMIALARKNLKALNLHAELQRGTVEALPYPDQCMDCVVNTMAFSGYPDGVQALSEIVRVLKPAGRVVLIDINLPENRNRIGTLLARGWSAAGDILRDMESLFQTFDLRYRDVEIGGFGSVHLYTAQRKQPT
jgi:ubiquinone/menaquinone biosynthesis C-methylase UbiE